MQMLCTLSEMQLFKRGAVMTDTILANFEKEFSTSPFISATELLLEELSIEFLIHKAIERKTTNCLFGPSGSGKSYNGVDMGCSVATGRDWHGRRTHRGAVLYLAGEGRGGLKRRLRAWCLHHGVDPAELNNLFVSRHTLSMESSNIDSIVDEVQGIDVALIIVDTLARHIIGHENDTADMGNFVRLVDELRDRLTSTAIIIHHTGLGDPSRGRGNSSLKAALDCEISCNNGLLEWTKTKDFEKPSSLSFKLLPVTIGFDEFGEEITSCVVVYGERAAANSSAQLSPMERQLLELAEGHPGILVGDLRNLFYEKRRERDPEAKQDTLKRAYNRSLDSLLGKYKVSMNGHQVVIGTRDTDGTCHANVTGKPDGTRDIYLKVCPDVTIPVPPTDPTETRLLKWARR
jgi:hypothetical protein